MNMKFRGTLYFIYPQKVANRPAQNVKLSAHRDVLLIMRCVGSGPDFFYASKLVFKILVLEK